MNYSLDRQEVATTDADRAADTPWNTYVREGLPATPICSPGQPALAAAETSRAGRLAVLRHRRPAGHHAVHPRLPAAPGQHRAGPTKRCARQRAMRRRGGMTARRAAVLGSPIAHSRSPQLHLAAYRALGSRRLDLRAHRVQRSRIARPGRRIRPRVGRGVGDDARQVRRAAVRRRTHPARRTGRLGQHPGADGGRLARRQHRRRRRDGRARTVFGRGPVAPRCSARAARRPPPSSGSPSSACTTSRSWPATPKGPPTAGRLGASARRRRAVDRTGHAAGGRRRGRSAPCPPTWPRCTPPPLLACRCCSTRSTTRGRRRWPQAVEPPRRPGRQRTADAAAPGVRPGRAVHRAAGAERGDERGPRLTLAFDSWGSGAAVRAACWMRR